MLPRYFWPWSETQRASVANPWLLSSQELLECLVDNTCRCNVLVGALRGPTSACATPLRGIARLLGIFWACDLRGNCLVARHGPLFGLACASLGSLLWLWVLFFIEFGRGIFFTLGDIVFDFGSLCCFTVVKVFALVFVRRCLNFESQFLGLAWKFEGGVQVLPSNCFFCPSCRFLRTQEAVKGGVIHYNNFFL